MKSFILKPHDSTDKSLFRDHARARHNPGHNAPYADPTAEAAADNKDELRILREIKKRKYRGKLYTFAKYCLGFHDMDPEVHGPLCDLLENAYYGRNRPANIPPDGIRKILILMSRGMLKSSIISIAFPQWILLQNDPLEATRDAPEGKTAWEPPTSFNGRRGCNQRIMISSLIEKNSKDWLATIKKSFEASEEIRDVFGQVAPQKRVEGVWTSAAANIAWRDNYNERDPNLASNSLDHSINSGHFDIGIFDDMVDASMITNPEMVEKAIKFHKSMHPVLWRPALMIYAGVRWGDNDLYGHFLESDEERGQFEVYKLKAYRDEDEMEATGKPFARWHKLSEEVLRQTEAALGSYDFSCNYGLDPIPQKNAAFKKEYFIGQRYALEDRGDDLAAWLGSLSVHTTSDPAISKEKRACKCVIVTCGWDYHGHCWLLDLFAKKGVQTSDYLEELFRQVQFWKSASVGVESIGFQELYQWNAERISEQTKVYLPWVELKPSGRIKDVRIGRLEPLFRNKQFHYRKEHVDLEKEALRWPHGKSKDIMDALAYQLDVAFPAEQPRDVEPEVDLNTFQYEREKFVSQMQRREKELMDGSWKNRRRA